MLTSLQETGRFHTRAADGTVFVVVELAIVSATTDQGSPIGVAYRTALGLVVERIDERSFRLACDGRQLHRL